MSTLREKKIIIDSLERCASKRRNCKGCAYADNCKTLYADAASLLSLSGSEGEDALDRIALLSSLINELEARLKDVEVNNIVIKAAADQYKASCIELEAYNKELFTAFNKMKALYHIKVAELEAATDEQVAYDEHAEIDIVKKENTE